MLRHRWKDNIKMDLKAIGCEDEDWVYLPQRKVQLAQIQYSAFIKTESLLRS
jgi:hypothetical protein